MEKINLEIEKYSFLYDEIEKFFIFVIPSSEIKPSTEFYIQKENNKFIKFCTGINVRDLNYSNQDFINKNIMEWIESYENDIELLEDYSEFNN